ncbi:MAG: acetyltransferase [Anaerolineales bacterium]
MTALLPIVMYGGGGHGKILIDLLRALGRYALIGIVDDGRSSGELVMGVPILGNGQTLAEIRARGVTLATNAVGGIGKPDVRIAIFDRLRETGFECPALIHPWALVEPSASIADGAQILARAYIGSEVQIGFGALINVGAIVSHECRIGNYVNISPGAMLAGNVEVGEAAQIGMGVTINLGIKIGARARIGNGATVKADVPEGGIVRAGHIWPP